MNPAARSITALLLGTVSIASLHALIPSHWFAFAVVGRAQRWTIRRTLLITLLAGSGHILLTVALGILVAGADRALLRHIPPQVEHAATAGLLILLGLYFAVPALRGKGHHHHNVILEEKEDAPETDAAHGERHCPAVPLKRMGDAPTVMGALVMGLTLSPCLDLLSVYVAASALPWQMLIVVSIVMAATTLSLMTLLVWLTLHGLQRLNLHWLEHNEGLVVGAVLIALGVLLFFIQ